MSFFSRASLVITLAAAAWIIPQSALAAGEVCTTYEDCAATEACAVGPQNQPSAGPVSPSSKICVPKDPAAIAQEYGSSCSADTDCAAAGLYCDTGSGTGVCNVQNQSDVPAGQTAIPQSPATPSAPASTPQNTSTGALQSAQSSGFGTNALGNTGLFNGSTDTLFVGLVRQVFIFIGALLVVIIIVGGIMYMTAAGSSSAVERAKGVITTGIVGAIIAFAAYLIAELVIRIITGTGPAV